MSSINRNHTRTRTTRGSVRSGPGPLRNLIDRLGLLESKVQTLESQLRLVKRKLRNSESSDGARGNLNSNSISEAVTRQLREQQFAVTLVPITSGDDIRITRLSAGAGAGTPGSTVPISSRPIATTTTIPASPVQGHGHVTLKTEPEGDSEAPIILGDFQDMEMDMDMDWGFQDQGEDLADSDNDNSKDPDWDFSGQGHNRRKTRSSETDTAADNSAPKLPKFKHYVYKEKAKFNSYAEAREFVLKERLWNLKNKSRSVEYTKIYFSCKFSKNCPARIYLSCDNESHKVKLYRTEEAHTHQEKIVGLPQNLRVEVQKLFESGVKRPKEILNTLTESGFEIPKARQINTFLEKLKASKNPKSKTKPHNTPENGQKPKRGRPRITRLKPDAMYYQSNSAVQNFAANIENANHHQADG